MYNIGNSDRGNTFFGGRNFFFLIFLNADQLLKNRLRKFFTRCRGLKNLQKKSLLKSIKSDGKSTLKIHLYGCRAEDCLFQLKVIQNKDNVKIETSTDHSHERDWENIGIAFS